MWTYHQRTGYLYRENTLLGQGYSGHGEGVNNAAMQDVMCIGPIPQGLYVISNAFTHPRTGKLTMRLVPHPATETFGRSGFMIHGDNSYGNDSASEGCIVMSYPVRLRISTSLDRELTVVSGQETNGESI